MRNNVIFHNKNWQSGTVQRKWLIRLNHVTLDVGQGDKAFTCSMVDSATDNDVCISIQFVQKVSCGGCCCGDTKT